jgi:hypothetical protein
MQRFSNAFADVFEGHPLFLMTSILTRMAVMVTILLLFAHFDQLHG